MEKIITQIQLQQLVNIYNSMLAIHTAGEDSFLMTDCMREFQKVIMELGSQQNDPKTAQ